MSHATASAPVPALDFRHPAVLALIALLSGCSLDDEASLSSPGGSLAVGAYYPVRFGDACGSSAGKMPTLCRSEGLIALDSIASSDTRVLRIVPAREADDRTLDTGLVFLGVGPGKATVRAYGRFSDGSTRSDGVEITVKAVTGVKIKQPCNEDSSGTIRGLPGESVYFHAYAMAGAEELQGFLPRLLDSVAGLAQTYSAHNTTATWQVPGTAIQIPLKSRVSSRVVGTLRTLAASEITDVRIADVNAPPYSLPRPDSFAVFVRMSIGRLRVCQTPPAALRTLTPEVCAGPQGETGWTRPTDGYVYVRMLREGRCQLQAGLDGKQWFGTRTLDLFLTTPPPDPSWGYRDLGAPCAIEGATSCRSIGSDPAVCRDQRWALLQTCAEGQICDFLVDGGKGCLAGAPCAACRGLRN